MAFSSHYFRLFDDTSSILKYMTKILRYWPVISIYTLSFLFGFIWSSRLNDFYWHEYIAGFMSAFLILFGATKLKDVNGFADRFASYDLIAKKYWWYGQLYPFIEIGLGIVMLLKHSYIPDIFMAVLALMGIVSVYRSIIKKQRLYCACLGTAFNVPLSYVAIFENSTMLLCAVAMIFTR